MFRTVLTWFVGLLAFGYAWFAAEDLSVPHWVVAIAFISLGVGLQLLYARLVNLWFDQIGLDDWTRVRLRSDQGVVPFRIAGIGIAARICFVAGIVFPILAAIGWLRPETIRVG